MKGYQFVPGENGKPDFQSKVKAPGETFSTKDYFKTVFISGDDMVKEEQEMKQKEIEAFNQKVVVDNKHFKVNTMVKDNVVQLDRYLNIREDSVHKIGLRFSKSRVAQLAGRQILATKEIQQAPVSIHKEEEYKMLGFRAPFKQFDPRRSVSPKDMETAIHPNFRVRSPISKRPIEAVREHEKQGAIWGK